MTTYASHNFKTKKAFKEAIAKDDKVTLWNPGLGQPNPNGKNYVSGPWYPLPHKWYAEAWCENGVVTKVK